MGFKEELSVFGSYVTYLFIAIGFLLTNTHTKQFYQLIIAFAILYAIVFPIRMVWFKNRPKMEPHHDWISKFTANSLISIHSARAVILASVLLSYFSFKPVFIALGALVIAMVCISRYLLRKHRPIDIIAGLLIGSLIAAVVLAFV
jgi:membrane-associated phospholipid phosphatase